MYKKRKRIHPEWMKCVRQKAAGLRRGVKFAMKLKPKGRKIYRQKTRFERTRDFLDNTGAIVGTAVLLAVLVFVGISVGKPVIQFLEERNLISKESASLPETAPTELPEETEGLSETEALTEVPETSQIQETLPPQAAREMHGYVLEADALATEDALRSALEKLPAGITHVIVPLKTQGGELHYASTVPDAVTSGAVVSAMKLSVMHSIITESGRIPAAYFNLLEDSVYPESFPQAGYTIAETGESWLDESLENNGKPWISPFSPISLDYLSGLSGEAAQAGFTVIICDGLVFPDFSENDLSLLSPEIAGADRNSVLGKVVENVRKSADSAQVYVQLKGTQVLDGTSEILKAEPITAGYIVTVSPEQLSQKLDFVAKIPDGVPCILQLEGKGTASQTEIDGNYVLHPGGKAEESGEPEMPTEPKETDAEQSE